MATSTRAWLTFVIALVAVFLFIVTEPVTIGERRLPDNPKQTERADYVLGPLHFYKPIPRVRLGLDLQGGSHVVLRAREQAVFSYKTTKPLFFTDMERGQLKAAVVASIPADAFEGLQLDLSRREISCRVNLEQDLQSRQQQLTKLLMAGPLAAYGPLQPQTPEPIRVTSSTLTRVADILERRVNKLGVSESLVQTQPPNRIIVELPGMKDPEVAMKALQSTAVLEFVHIDKRYQREEDETGRVIIKDEKGNNITKKVLAAGDVIVTGEQLEPKCHYQPGTDGEPTVAFRFKPRGAQTFWEFTRANRGEILAVVLDGEIISAPVVNDAIRGDGVIEGGFKTMAEAQRLADLLNAGALPVPLEVAENRTVGATLGRDSLMQSLYAGLLGLALVLLFMAWYYRLPGLLADLALCVYCLLVMGVLKLFGATLTLPGIAGVIISIGMAVDANVIIFERLKEELRAGKTLRSAIDAAFKRAFTAILDSNVCSIITALVLMSLGTGAVKGFAVTLLIGVTCSMFTAITITRLFMNLVAGAQWAKNLRLYGVELENAGGRVPATGGQGA